jgi:hypothetical protein
VRTVSIIRAPSALPAPESRSGRIEDSSAAGLAPGRYERTVGIGESRKPDRAADPFVVRDRTNELIARWRAPVMDESVIDAFAAQYLLTPRVDASFVEYLIFAGVGEVGPKGQ